RLTQPQNQIGFSAGGMVSITTASAVYVPPTTEILRKMDTKTSKRRHKRKKKVSAVISVDLDENK
ncbi:MAG: hypothetical protein AB1349_11980, partial [Elusimicrobiota bacterium]